MKATLFLVLLPLSARAEDRIFVDFRGWTDDSRSAVYVIHELSIDPESGSEFAAATGYIVDGRTGESKAFAGKAIADLDKWIAGHPLKKLPGRASPDGKATARIDLLADDAKRAWKDALFSFGCPDAETCFITDGRMTFGVERGGSRFAGWSWSEQSAGNLHGTVTPFWTPDGHRVAWALTRGYAMMNDFGYGRVAISAAGPSVELLASKTLDSARVDAAADVLEKAGLYPTKRGAAQKEREKSAIFFATGFEAEAKAAAAALPGGATIEKLTWKSDAHLVIAVGRSLLSK